MIQNNLLVTLFNVYIFFSVTLFNNLEWTFFFFSPAGFTKSVSDVLVARQPLRGGVEHKFKGASQLPDQLMTNVKVPVMSTIDFAFLLSPDLTLQKREQRHTCTKPSLSPPLSVFSLCFPASVLSFQKVDFVPIRWWPRTLTYISCLTVDVRTLQSVSSHVHHLTHLLLSREHEISPTY